MTTAAPLQKIAVKSPPVATAKALQIEGASLLLQRKCACGRGTSSIGGECEECSKKKITGLQTKLRVNEPGDVYEQEADRVAHDVLAKSARPGLISASPRIQRLAGHSKGQLAAAPSSVDSVLASPGRPLDPALRQDMEERFGCDFAKVRIHSGAAADRSADDVNSNAYTVEHHIVFGAGRYAPASLEGRRLLAHELTHVLQQTGAVRQPEAYDRAGIPKSATGTLRTSAILASQSAGPSFLQREEKQAVRVSMHPEETGRFSGSFELPGGGLLHYTVELHNVPALLLDQSNRPKLELECQFGIRAALQEQLKSGPPPSGGPALQISIDAGYSKALNAKHVERMVRRAARAELKRVIAQAQKANPASPPLAKSAPVLVELASEAAATFSPALEGVKTLAAGGEISAEEAPKEAELVAAIEMATKSVAGKVNDIELAERAYKATLSFTLSDPTLLKRASEAVREVAGPGAMVEYLALVEQRLTAPQPDPFEVLRVKRRGPYGTYVGSGLYEVMSGPLGWLVAFAENVKAFLHGLYLGVSESVSEEAAAQFGKRLGGSVVLNLLFPVPFLAGTAAGLWEMVKGFAETISNIKEVVEAILELIGTMFTPAGYVLAKAMGRGMGVEYGKTIVDMSQMNLVRFAYHLGKLIGPTILLIVLSLLGVPQAAAAAVSARLAEIIGPVAKRFPRLARLMGKVTKKGVQAEAKPEAVLATERRALHEAKPLELPEAAKYKRAAEDAAKFVEKHPEKIFQDASGYRHAPVEGGHQIVQVPDPVEGIACEWQSPTPHIRVPCPPRMRETIEEFKKRGGVIKGEGHKLDPKDMPKSPSHVTEVGEPGLPEGFEDMPHGETRTRKQTGISLEEDHHIATRYIKKNREIFKKAGLSIDDDLNLIKDFPEHGQLRGWYDWKKRHYSFEMKGHHKEYNKWVTRLLEQATTPDGLPPDQYLDRITKLTQNLNAAIRKYPEVLSHGPDILPLSEHLKIRWD